MASTIKLATLEDVRAISSQNAHELLDFPHLYIPTDDPDVMRAWGMAGNTTGNEDRTAVTERLFPGTLVSPRFVGQTASRADLLYHGAEPAADFPPSP